ncbi:MAG TPA: uracil-DNA glycosylase [Candidatus Cloacimonas sp.]|nr:uracil-DNA glycosylase [Candidatus Cloacimonas sp.]HPS60448.1 uracil-DNA glycosylase [Candidatus Cloacimonas sp.]
MSVNALRQYLEFLKNSGIKELYLPESNNQKRLNELQHQYSNCTKCSLSQSRHNFVYGEGNPNALAMLIGEGPGEQEDKTGRPFVGAAGQLLEKMLAAINLKRSDVYIANIVKCRPPGNRNPEADERRACLPYLLEQIQIIQPKLLLLLGLVSAQTLLNNNNTLGWHRGKIHYFMDIPALVTYHPSALLRNPEWKKPAWVDLQEFQKEYEKLRLETVR